PLVLLDQLDLIAGFTLVVLGSVDEVIVRRQLIVEEVFHGPSIPRSQARDPRSRKATRRARAAAAVADGSTSRDPCEKLPTALASVGEAARGDRPVMASQIRVLPAAVPGLFYPDDPFALRSTADSLLAAW